MKFEKELTDLFYTLMEKHPDLDEVRNTMTPFITTRKMFNTTVLGLFERKKATLAKKNHFSLCACDLHQIARVTEALGFKLTKTTKEALMANVEDCGSNDLSVLGITTKKH